MASKYELSGGTCESVEGGQQAINCLGGISHQRQCPTKNERILQKVQLAVSAA
jgi:hypothetical protein